MIDPETRHKMKIPNPRNVWNSSVVKVYREYGREMMPYAIAATVIGVFASLASQFRQVSFGLMVETLGGSESASAFPYAEVILPASKDGRIMTLIFILVAIFVINAISGLVTGYLWSVFRHKLAGKLRVQAYSATQNLTPKRFIQRGTGEYTSLIMRDTRGLGRLPRSIVSGGLQNIVKVLTMGGVLIALNWQFALLTMAMIPVIVWWTPKYGDLVNELYSEQFEARSKFSGTVTSSIEGIFTVKSYAAEERMEGMIQSQSDEYRDTVIQNSLKRSIYGQVFSLATSGTSLFVIAVGSIWVLNGPPLFFTQELTLGAWTVFYTNSTLLLSPARQAKSYVSTFKKSQASADRVYALLNQAKEDSDSDKRKFEEVDGRIEYEEAYFKYNFEDESPLATVENKDKSEDEDDKDNEDSTDDEDDSPFEIGPISRVIEEGQTVGIVGKSGSGKSTFVKLLVNFLETDEGKLLVDGKDSSEYDSASLRDHIGYVSQDPYLFNGTLRDNIGFGAPEASEEDIEDAVREASMEDVVDKFDDGLDTELGEDGARLSGGQKQRVAIARALASDPDILVLDEATSHVDNITENNIKKSIKSAGKDRTVLVIAHRLSTVCNADRILVFEDGEIIEDGSHEKLTDKGGRYAELWRNHIGISE